jgi:epoxyqueuosine reductase
MIEEILKSHLIPADDYVYGFADLTGLIDPKFKGFNYGISIGKRLDNKIVDTIINGPTKEYYFHYRQMNEDLSQLTQKISNDLNDNYIETINIEPTVSINDLDSIYFKTLRTDLSHKMVATRTGLGWIGKTDLFVSKKFGPRLRLVSILLRTPVKAKIKTVDKSYCGSCNICVDICPAKAANGRLWDKTVEREEFFDAWKCRNKCQEFGRERFGLDVRICGICVAACPVGQNRINLKVPPHA